LIWNAENDVVARGEVVRYLNGFIIIGVALLLISIGGLATGNRFLTEPGQAVNPYSWMLYLAASVLMLINGGVSIWHAQQNEKENPKPAEKEAKGEAQAETTAPEA
jgi:hypothetical protein